MAHQCVFCGGTFPGREMVMIRIRFYPVKIYGFSDTDYCGIRHLCKQCLAGIGCLAAQVVEAPAEAKP